LNGFPSRPSALSKNMRCSPRDEKILVAVSGGKDSLSLWDILVRLGYQADGLYLGLGIDGGIQLFARVAAPDGKSLRDEHNLKLHVVDIEKEYGHSIPVLSEISHRGHGKPCSVCGLAKRHEMNRIARDLGYDVLATGHNLDDEAAVLFGNTCTGRQNICCGRDLSCLASDGLARKVKPLCRFYEREMTAYCPARYRIYLRRMSVCRRFDPDILQRVVHPTRHAADTFASV
jgi:tRNA-5-methyluridine54 2-sulfurtransferase